MERKSPYGAVCALQLVGVVSSTSAETLHLSVAFVLDNGINTQRATCEKAVDWGSQGESIYTAALAQAPEPVTVSLAYYHDVDGGTLHHSIMITFPPHGWVKFPEAIMPLDRTMTELRIPLDVSEDHMTPVAVKLPFNLESIYGKRIDRSLAVTQHFLRPRPLARPNAYDIRLAAAEQRDPIEVAAERVKRMKMGNEGDDPDEVSFHAFHAQRDIAMAQEQRRCHQATLEWGDRVRAFVKGLFGNDGRRARAIIGKWWSRRAPPVVDGDTLSSSSAAAAAGGGGGSRPTDDVAAFITKVLYSCPALSLTDTHVYLFGKNSPGSTANWAVVDELAIPLSWLTTSEQQLCASMYVNRAILFASVSSLPQGLTTTTTTTTSLFDGLPPINGNSRADPSALASMRGGGNRTTGGGAVGVCVAGVMENRYQLGRCRLDASVVVPSVCTRFVVQQFALDVYRHTFQSQRAILLLTLIAAVGKCHVAQPMDRFLYRLKGALECASIGCALDEMDLFVPINSVQPDYETNLLDAMPAIGGQRQGRPRTISARTPMRLTTNQPL